MRDEEQITAFVTKYALSSGIQKLRGVLSEDAKYFVMRDRYTTLYRWGTDAHTSREAAEAHARETARKKVESLKKQLAKVEKLAEQPKWAK